MATINLNSRRGQIKSIITRTRKYFDNLDVTQIDAKTIVELKIRLSKVEPLFEKFDEVQSEIEYENKRIADESNPYDNSLDEIERVTFEQSYYSLITDINHFISLHDKGCSSISQHSNEQNLGSLNNNQSSPANLLQQIKLPTISLPQFQGQYNKWVEFRDCFKALINDNVGLTDIQKFYYLRSSLQKEAFQIIESIQVSAENYSIAWKMLNERFEQKSLIVHSHVRAIFEYPCLKSESHTELRQLFDAITKHLRSLNTLGEPTENWDTLIIYILSSKMDPITRREWELSKKDTEIPTMNDINKFLKQRCEVLEKIEFNQINKSNNEKRGNNYKAKPQTHAYVSQAAFSDNTKFGCYYCNKEHTIYQCESFLKLTPSERITQIKKLKLCYNCCRPNHNVQECTASSCKKCGRRHNSLLHLERETHGNTTSHTQTPKNETSNVVQTSGAPNEYQKSVEKQGNTTTALHTVFKSFNIDASQVLLSTASVHVQDARGNLHQCRALLDNGSQSNFITGELCKKLNLQVNKINYAVGGINETKSSINSYVDLKLVSRNNTYEISLQCLVLPTITEHLPSISFNKGSVKIPNNLQLADPNFNKSGPIDILLGSTIFWELLCVGQVRLHDSRLKMHKTRLGWIVVGDLGDPTRQLKSISCLSTNQVNNESLDNRIAKFWQIEELNVRSTLSASEQFCESHFESNFKRDPDTGKFIVKIPFKENLTQLGNSREFAISRFFSQERKLSKNARLRSQYSDFMREYEQLGHMVKIDESIPSKLTYYIPHHAVIRESSVTTKLRVVFDASMKTDNGLSLNDVQHVGPVMQNDLLSIILRFRTYNYVMTGDIQKMYRMILLDSQDRALHRIFWRSNEQEPVNCYELQTVTYGTASAPYLATRCLYQVAVDHENFYSTASKAIKTDFYVDDLLTGANSKNDLVQLQHDISTILSSAGLELRKWLSNDNQLQSQFLINDKLDSSILSIGDSESNKTLGILWNATSDTIQFSTSNLQNNHIVTKRTILSAISQVYDPLGLLGPVIVVAKLLIQKLWQANLSWDEAIPQELYSIWLKLRNDLPLLVHITIPRQVTVYDYEYIELHAFADASEKAFGACIYIRSKSKTGKFLSNLLTSKSRVCPIKQLSLPRLELCAALLAAQLMNKVLEAVNTKFDKVYLWSDSSITLCWLKGCPSRWKTFVANRVSEIQRLTQTDDWHHVPSHDNPADLLSRGSSIQELKNCELYWTGPAWLSDTNLNWPTSNKCFEQTDANEEVPEQRTLVNLITNNNFYIFAKFSSLTKLQRVTAYVLRFISNSKLQSNLRQLGVLQCNELENSLFNLIRIAQQERLSDDYRRLKTNLTLNKKSRLLCLNPFMDHNNLIRVGGRINNANREYDHRHPIILPAHHQLTKLILIHEHERLLHCGATMLLASIRQRFWPISGRNIAKAVVRQCVRCFKVNPPSSGHYLMGNLPECRVNQNVPFFNTGCDFAGPFLLRDRNTRVSRGGKLIKGYVCLFICLVTKALHLEALSDLSTECFLATLKRFIGRRGKPLNIYTDNATTFVGADASLKKLYEFLNDKSNEISNNLAHENITWHFIPARSPNFGGIWEAGIKSAKFHMKRVMGESHLNFEDFSTVLVQIEAVLNSRPLCPLSTSSDDLNPLTPAHFLVGKPLTTLPERTYVNINENRLKRYERLQKIVQHFWSRWNIEYLSEMQTRTKWKEKSPNYLKVGTIVLVKEENSPPLQWHIGRVVELHPGKDNVTRVVSVLTNNKVLRRVVSKVCVFPFERGSNDPNT